MSDCILKLQGITKEFPGVKALSDVSFSVERGHIHALVGENGAGKSTLIKIISGVYPYGTYSGDVIYNGEVCKFKTIKSVEKQGIVCIHQEMNLVPDMTVSENIFLNNNPAKGGIIDFDVQHSKCMELLKEIGLNVNPEEPLRNLGVGQQQMVEIAKAISRNVKLLLLDEPTAALTDTEVEALFRVVRKLQAGGVTCIYISHRLDEIMELCDDITVLRDGQTIDTKPCSEMTKDQMITLMVGREMSNMYPRVEHTQGEVGFEVRNFSVPNPDIPGRMLIRDVSFKAYKGQILGVAGLMGAGRTELFTAIYGAFRTKGVGEVFIDGKQIAFGDPKKMLEQGFFLVTEDRKKLGLNLMMSLRENVTMPSLGKVSKHGVLNMDAEVRYSKKYLEDMHTKMPNIEVAANTLSGGNQQKVVLAKALMSEPKVMILDEPTRGIDVGAKYEIYKIMNELVDRGVVIIMISSEMEEIFGMSDRIIVLANGEITGELNAKEATQERVMQAAIGR
ncbi:MAG: ATP-binding cassette domain-containing protein [Lachnospiraceae bacterium]|jgi:D-xylose transport system ATP-binding protein|nr:ATP-binding cassette domain-containing protein [Lachnospiraceae bacterium]MCI1328928.1 ATP-binding cassette domain-containing protein [Lachnospiraceae bacterium]